jgi:serine/threonine protein kinase
MGMKSTVKKLLTKIIRVSSDIWSLGLSLMELGYGTHPFPRLKPDEIEELMRLPEGTPVRTLVFGMYQILFRRLSEQFMSISSTFSPTESKTKRQN